MAEQMYSAEEAARILGLQVRTVRGYIRDGRLPGRRIGKQYRIARVDLEAFTAGFAGSAATPATPAAAPAEHRITEQAPHPIAEVSSVVQIDAIELPAWERLERTLTAAAVASGGEVGDLRLEPLYDEQRRRLRLIIVASVSVTAELLRVIEAMTRDDG
ncbi:MAG: helix-turn-helix domain-containing protein [Acidobacteriota bacterium]|nr:helix-turn-helix domain-containing protein [Acidobacteriota bacterium]